MTRVLPILLLAGGLLFLCGLSALCVLLSLIIIVLAILVEDMAIGGDLTSNLVKEIKREPKEPIVIHDVVIERDEEEDFSWRKESNNSRVYSTDIIKHTGRGYRR